MHNRSMKTVFLGILFFALTFSHANEHLKAQLSSEGLKDFKFGMTLNEVNSKLRKKIIAPQIEQRATANCYYASLNDLPGVGFVFVDDVLKRIDVEAPDVTTPPHVSVGDNQREAIERIRNAKTEPLDYVPEGFILIQEIKHSPNGIIYQFNDHKVVKIISGDKKVIRFAEACD